MFQQRYGVFVTLLLVTFLSRIITHMSSSLNPLYVRDVLGANLTEVGLTATLYSLATLILTYSFSASINPRFIPLAIIVSFLVCLVSTSGFYFSNSLVVFFVFIFILGMANGIFNPLMPTLVNLVSPSGRVERNIALFSLSLSFGLVLGPLIQSLFLAMFEIRLIFLLWSAISAFMLLSSLNLSRLRLIRPIEQGRTTEYPLSSPSLYRRLSDILTDKLIAMLLVSRFASVIYFELAMTFGGIYARNAYQSSYSTIMAVFSLMFVTTIIIRVALTLKSPIKRKMLLLELLLLGGVSGALLAFLAPSLEVFAIGFSFIGLLHGGAFPLILAIIVSRVPPERLASANSVVASVPFISGMFVPPIVGSLANFVGLSTSVLTVLMFAGIPVLVMMEIIRRHEHEY